MIGSTYYNTAVELRAEAKKARESYPAELVRAEDLLVDDSDEAQVRAPLAVAHAGALIQQATALEIAAALYCVAQAIEDSSS